MNYYFLSLAKRLQISKLSDTSTVIFNEMILVNKFYLIYLSLILFTCTRYFTLADNIYVTLYTSVNDTFFFNLNNKQM